MTHRSYAEQLAHRHGWTGDEWRAAIGRVGGNERARAVIAENPGMTWTPSLLVDVAGATDTDGRRASIECPHGGSWPACFRGDHHAVDAR